MASKQAHTHTPFHDDFLFRYVLDSSAVLGLVRATENIVSDARDLHLVGEVSI